MNKEYVLEKLAESIGEYIGDGAHPIVSGKGYLNKSSKQRDNARELIKSHKRYMDETGKPIAMKDYIRAIETGEIANPLKSGFFKRHGKAALMVGGGALAGALALNLMQNKQQVEPQQDPLLYAVPAGQPGYGQ